MNFRKELNIWCRTHANYHVLKPCMRHRFWMVLVKLTDERRLEK